ncbi:MoaD/ThiS family protein [Chloroflexota bacterium]
MANIHIEFLSWLADTTGADSLPGYKITGGQTVRSVLGDLAARHPVFGQSVFNTSSRILSENVVILLNETHLELIDGLDTVLADGDNLVLVPALQGG